MFRDFASHLEKYEYLVGRLSNDPIKSINWKVKDPKDMAVAFGISSISETDFYTQQDLYQYWKL